MPRHLKLNTILNKKEGRLYIIVGEGVKAEH
jgi:hypothetical protein